MGHASEIRAAAARIPGFAVRTPFHALGGDNLLVKREDLQMGGSFKIRGAANKFLVTEGTKRQRGLVTVSTGNTGRALCDIGEKFSVPVHVFVLEDCEPRKSEHLSKRGAIIHSSGRSFFAASIKAHDFADEHGMLFCSSSADWDFVHGLGTITLELLDEHPDLDVLFLPIGGGGLAAGVGTAYAALPEIKGPRIIGVQPVNSRPIYECFHHGQMITTEPMPTTATCLAGEPEKGAIIMDIFRSVLSDIVLVTDEEIDLARERLASFGITVEPGAAAGYAAYLGSTDSGAMVSRGDTAEKTGVILTGAA
jgi:threonine dehydratase